MTSIIHSHGISQSCNRDHKRHYFNRRGCQQCILQYQLYNFIQRANLEFVCFERQGQSSEVLCSLVSRLCFVSWLCVSIKICRRVTRCHNGNSSCVRIQLDTTSAIISATVTSVTATCGESEVWNIQYRFYDILAAT